MQLLVLLDRNILLTFVTRNFCLIIQDRFDAASKIFLRSILLLVQNAVNNLIFLNSLGGFKSVLLASILALLSLETLVLLRVSSDLIHVWCARLRILGLNLLSFGLFIVMAITVLSCLRSVYFIGDTWLLPPFVRSFSNFGVD